MAQERQRYALQTIFSFFLGLMIVAFIGVGVNTFYPSPNTQYEQQLQELSRRQEDITGTPDKAPATLSPQQEAELKKVRDEQRALEDKMQAEMKPWARNTSIIIIVFATMVMALSLVRSDQLKVISNGLLLGGLFSMVYGTGWVIFSGESTARFVVMVFALAVTIGLGYLKFVSSRPVVAPPSDTASPGGSAPAAIGDLETRVAALEARAAAAAAALAPQGARRDGSSDE
jgi:hypothetical protein